MKLYPMKADNDCLYSAVGLHLGITSNHLRNMLADYIETTLHSTNTIELEEGLSGINYVQSIRINEKAGNNETNMLMHMLKRPILLFDSDGNLTNSQVGNDFSDRPICIYFNGVTHYAILLIDGKLTAENIYDSLMTGRELLKSTMYNAPTHLPGNSSPESVKSAKSDEYVRRMEHVLENNPMILSCFATIGEVV